MGSLFWILGDISSSLEGSVGRTRKETFLGPAGFLQEMFFRQKSKIKGPRTPLGYNVSVRNVSFKETSLLHGRLRGFLNRKRAFSCFLERENTFLVQAKEAWEQALAVTEQAKETSVTAQNALFLFYP